MSIERSLMTEIPRLKSENIVFIFIDLQKKLLDAIPQSSDLVSGNIVLLEAARILGVPYTVTTQYRKGLGELDEAFARYVSVPVFDKTSFSCGADSSIRSHLDQFQREWAVVSGIETHICVLQTSLDLLRNGKKVAVVADAVGARHHNDHQAGLTRMEQSGALMVTREMLLYELLGRSDSENFKRILPLIKSLS